MKFSHFSNSTRWKSNKPNIEMDNCQSTSEAVGRLYECVLVRVREGGYFVWGACCVTDTLFSALCMLRHRGSLSLNSGSHWEAGRRGRAGKGSAATARPLHMLPLHGQAAPICLPHPHWTSVARQPLSSMRKMDLFFFHLGNEE